MLTATYPNDIVGLDTVGPLTLGEDGNQYLITLIDYATGWAEAYPARDRNAESVIRVLERDYIPRHGPPAILIHDNGKEFMNRAFINYCMAWGVETRHTNIYHPETNRKVERFHHTLKNILRKLVNNLRKRIAATQEKKYKSYVRLSKSYVRLTKSYVRLTKSYDLLSRTYDLASRFTTMPTYTHNISSLILEVEIQNWYQIEA